MEKNLDKNKSKQLANLRPHRFTSTDQPEGRGRPKGSLSLTALLRKSLSENNADKAKVFVKGLIKQGSGGNPAAIKEIMGRIDGAIPEKVEVDFSGNIMAAVSAILSGEGREKK